MSAMLGVGSRKNSVIPGSLDIRKSSISGSRKMSTLGSPTRKQSINPRKMSVAIEKQIQIDAQKNRANPRYVSLYTPPQEHLYEKTDPENYIDINKPSNLTAEEIVSCNEKYSFLHTMSVWKPQVVKAQNVVFRNKGKKEKQKQKLLEIGGTKQKSAGYGGFTGEKVKIMHASKLKIVNDMPLAEELMGTHIRTIFNVDIPGGANGAGVTSSLHADNDDLKKVEEEKNKYVETLTELTVHTPITIESRILKPKLDLDDIGVSKLTNGDSINKDKKEKSIMSKESKDVNTSSSEKKQEHPKCEEKFDKADDKDSKENDKESDDAKAIHAAEAKLAEEEDEIRIRFKKEEEAAQKAMDALLKLEMPPLNLLVIEVIFEDESQVKEMKQTKIRDAKIRGLERKMNKIVLSGEKANAEKVSKQLEKMKKSREDSQSKKKKEQTLQRKKLSLHQVIGVFNCDRELNPRPPPAVDMGLLDWEFLLTQTDISNFEKVLHPLEWLTRPAKGNYFLENDKSQRPWSHPGEDGIIYHECMLDSKKQFKMAVLSCAPTREHLLQDIPRNIKGWCGLN